MAALKILALSMVLSTAYADWRIYIGGDMQSFPETGGGSYSLLWPINNEPNCDQFLCTSHLINGYNDVTVTNSGWACDGCTSEHVSTWNIDRLELGDIGSRAFTTEALGHITLYPRSDAKDVYDLVFEEKADGSGASGTRGYCDRIKDNPDDVDCAGNKYGVHAFTCVTDIVLRDACN
ncbi:hypothetical protein ACJ41O_009281 [Fusarium nematophilum]